MEPREELLVDLPIDSEKLTDLVHDVDDHDIPDAGPNEEIEPENANAVDADDAGKEGKDIPPAICLGNNLDKSLGPPWLVEEPDARPQRCNPLTGSSYQQK